MFEARIDQLVYDFNCRPSAYVHGGWIGDAQRPVIERMARSGDAQARAQADHWLSRHLGLAGVHDFEFSHPGKRLLLLDAPALADIARLLGLTCLMHMLRGWITRTQRNRLAEALGDGTARFVFEQLLHWPQVAHRVLDQGARRACERGNPGDTHWLVDAECFGARLLLLACDEPQGSAARRARFKLPPNWAIPERQRPLAPGRQRAVLEFAIGCAVKERHPAWHWLF
jgi:hypothetical protein